MCRKNFDETTRLQSEIRGETLQGIAESASSSPRLASSSPVLFPGRNECPRTQKENQEQGTVEGGQREKIYNGQMEDKRFGDEDGAREQR